MSVPERHAQAERIAADAGFTPELLKAGQFTLQTYHRGLAANSDLLAIYIEGDGHAWKTRYRLSDDPTPKNPLALKLAIAEPLPSVIYIARPCQFISGGQAGNCLAKYWSSHRYAEEVVGAIDQAIDAALSRMPQQATRKIVLVGYSGGGSIAILLAARRTDVAGILTVAANLDHAQWTTIHRISPLGGSLNAAHVARQIRLIPQRHYVGGQDRNMPVEIVAGYKAKAGQGSLIQSVVIEDFDHACCWARDWAMLRCPQDQTLPGC